MLTVNIFFKYFALISYFHKLIQRFEHVSVLYTTPFLQITLTTFLGCNTTYLKSQRHLGCFSDFYKPHNLNDIVFENKQS